MKKAAVIVLSDPKAGSEESLGDFLTPLERFMISKSAARMSSFCFKARERAGRANSSTKIIRLTRFSRRSKTKLSGFRAAAPMFSAQETARRLADWI